MPEKQKLELHSPQYNVRARLEELTRLERGWLDRENGEPLHKDGAKWLREKFSEYYDSENLPLPATFPTPDGNIQFEWSINHHEIALGVDLSTKQAEFYVLNTINQEELAESLDLRSEQMWHKLNLLIKETFE